MVKNNNEFLQYDPEESTVPRFATEEEILASFGYKQVIYMLWLINVKKLSSHFFFFGLFVGNA